MILATEETKVSGKETNFGRIMLVFDPNIIQKSKSCLKDLSLFPRQTKNRVHD